MKRKKFISEAQVRPRTVKPNLGKSMQFLKGIFQTSRQPLVNARLVIVIIFFKFLAHACPLVGRFPFIPKPQFQILYKNPELEINLSGNQKYMYIERLREIDS
jgi:hypothetical protein